MFDNQKFFTHFANLVERLNCRGLTTEQLINIKESLGKRKKLLVIVNQLRQERNQLSQDGQKNIDKVKVIKKNLAFHEEEKQVKKKFILLLHRIKKLSEVEYQQGRGEGWMYKKQRVSVHQLEAYLVWYLFKKD